MKKALAKSSNISGVRQYVDGKLVDGPPTNLYGNVSGLRGNVSGLSGDVSGLSGDVTGLRGDVDECDLTQSERDQGVDVGLLIGGENASHP